MKTMKRMVWIMLVCAMLTAAFAAQAETADVQSEMVQVVMSADEVYNLAVERYNAKEYEQAFEIFYVLSGGWKCIGNALSRLYV